MKDGFRILAMNPEDPDGEKVEIVIPSDLVKRWYKKSSVDYWNLETARQVLEKPQRIFRGVRVYEQGGYCYVGTPGFYFLKPQIEVPLPPGMLFAVYVNPNMRLYQQRLEKSAADDPMCPIDWKSRYGELLWKSTS